MSPEKVKNLVVIKCNHQALIKLVFSVIYQHMYTCALAFDFRIQPNN